MSSKFRAWFDENLGEWAHDIARHGADAGYPHITYTSDCVKLFNEFEDEIWEMAVTMADDMGEKNVASFIAGFKRADMLESVDTFKNLMVWFACEELARAKENENA